MYRSILGDRLYHRHDVPTTDTENTTLYSLIKRTTNVTDIPLSVFMVPDIMVRAVTATVERKDPRFRNIYMSSVIRLNVSRDHRRSPSPTPILEVAQSLGGKRESKIRGALGFRPDRVL